MTANFVENSNAIDSWIDKLRTSLENAKAALIDNRPDVLLHYIAEQCSSVRMIESQNTQLTASQRDELGKLYKMCDTQQQLLQQAEKLSEKMMGAIMASRSFQEKA